MEQDTMFEPSADLAKSALIDQLEHGEDPTL